MSADRSISRRATRTQLMRVFASILKESEKGFRPSGAIRVFKIWYGQQREEDQPLIRDYAVGIFDVQEKRLKLVRETMWEEVFGE